MKEIIILVGPPGSGKSTLAKEYSLTHVRVSQDDQGKDHLNIFHKAIADGTNIIIDRMSFNKEQRERYLVPARAAGYATKIIVLHVDSKTCLDRMMKRVGHPTVKNEANAKAALRTFMTKYERVEDSEADVVERRWPEGHKPMCIVSDMDNTLADATHREHHVNTPGQKKDWKAFFDGMGDDPVNHWGKSIINAHFNCYLMDVLIVSARPDNYRNVTESWLLHNEIDYSELIMRARDDFRKDDVVKEQLYEFEIKTRFDVLFWLDDRKQVIDKIRSHGVTVLDCAGPKGEF